MSKLLLQSDTQKLIKILDGNIRNHTLKPSLKYTPQIGEEFSPDDENTRQWFQLFRDAGISLDSSTFPHLESLNLIRIKDTRTPPVNFQTYEIIILPALHALVEREFEAESTNPLVNITTQHATVNITHADAVNLINNNVQLADALENRLRDIISAEHAFIFDAINELRTAVDNASKQTALQKVYGAAAHINDAYGLIQIAVAIASLIRY